MFTNSRRISCGPVSTAIPQILFFNVFLIQFCVKWHQSQFSALPVTKAKNLRHFFYSSNFLASDLNEGLSNERKGTMINDRSSRKTSQD